MTGTSIYLSIHPSILYSACQSRVAGKLQAIQAGFGPDLHCFGQWDETNIPRETKHANRKGRSQPTGSNPEPSCCEGFITWLWALSKPLSGVPEHCTLFWFCSAIMWTLFTALMQYNRTELKSWMQNICNSLWYFKTFILCGWDRV